MLEPIELYVERGCHFKKKPKKGKVQPRGCLRCDAAKGDRIHVGAPPSLNVLGSGDPGHFQTLKQQWTEILADLLVASGLPRGLERLTVEGEVTFPDRGRRDQGNYRVLLEKALGDTLVNGWWQEVAVSKVPCPTCEGAGELAWTTKAAPAQAGLPAPCPACGGSRVDPELTTRPTKDPDRVKVQRIPGGWLEDDDWSRYEFGGLAYRYAKGVSATRLLLFPAGEEAPPPDVPAPIPGQLTIDA